MIVAESFSETSTLMNNNNNNNITDDTDNFPPMEALNIENTLLSTPVDTDQ